MQKIHLVKEFDNMAKFIIRLHSFVSYISYFDTKRVLKEYGIFRELSNRREVYHLKDISMEN